MDCYKGNCPEFQKLKTWVKTYGDLQHYIKMTNEHMRKFIEDQNRKELSYGEIVY